MKIETNLYEAYIHLPLFFGLCLATRLWVVQFAVGARYFHLLKCVEIGPGAHQASDSRDIGTPSLGGEAEHSPPPSPQVKNK